MGHREVRPVPLGWEHPTDPGTYSNGEPRYRALFSRANLRRTVQFYDEHPEYAGEWEYNPADYMPEIPEGTPLGWQLYETTSEGTPVSPVFPTLEELATWCETGATVFASLTWTREQWLASFRNDSLDVDSLGYITPGRGIHTGDPLAAGD
jgi:hypothetical protein